MSRELLRQNVGRRPLVETEKTLERKLSRKVKESGGWCLKLSALHVAGLPDRICLFPGGKIIFAEVKGTGLKPEKIQIYVHSKLRRLGFDCRVIDSTKGIEELIEDAKRD